ncbi:D-Ala-D-Ala carboxypeptidase family metallohydrolase [Nitratireductor sp.]|uniref:D-Ala-D-Ala carboxypeptidase family metallohydrolase n=1 Tax=Nitratireductor sp. TaxID=1872084 RepID=UPI0025E0D8C7|nr:D-Ala-D-Ala carboxypeptidase family metallohydrolase [Nitratireductor sp.]
MTVLGHGRISLTGVICALFLASCSTTSDPVTQLGLAPTALQSGDSGPDLSTSDGVLFAAADGADGSETSGSVPLPSERPGQKEEVASTEEVSAETAAAAQEESVSATETAAAGSPSEETASPTESAPTQTATASPVPEDTSDEVSAADATPPPESESASKRQSFLSAFFSAKEPKAAKAAEKATRPLIDTSKAKPAETSKVMLASASPDTKPVQASVNMGSALPGVRQGESLFEFSSKTGSGDADADIYEEEPAYQVASAAGMARLAPNGLLKQRESVDTACLKPALVGMLKAIERHYGKRIVVTSGYRSPSYNRRVRGARKSLHMYCAAADIQIDGVSKWELAKYVRSMPGRGGVGTYCHTKSVHVDVGPERDWNWRCRRRK